MEKCKQQDNFPLFIHLLELQYVFMRLFLGQFSVAFRSRKFRNCVKIQMFAYNLYFLTNKKSDCSHCSLLSVRQTRPGQLAVCTDTLCAKARQEREESFVIVKRGRK
jgi:hypothetical protein